MRWWSRLALAGMVVVCASGEWTDATNNGGLPIDSPASPSVGIVRQGHLLILTYKPPTRNGGPSPAASIGVQSPAFTVYKGKRKIVSRQFEPG